MSEAELRQNRLGSRIASLSWLVSKPDYQVIDGDAASAVNKALSRPTSLSSSIEVFL